MPADVDLEDVSNVPKRVESGAICPHLEGLLLDYTML